MNFLLLQEMEHANPIYINPAHILYYQKAEDGQGTNVALYGEIILEVTNTVEDIGAQLCHDT